MDEMYVNNIFSMVIYDDSNEQYTETWFGDITQTFDYMYNYLNLTHDFDATKQRAYIYNPLALLDWRNQKPLAGKDYMIREKNDLKRNKILMMRGRDASVGDVILYRAGKQVVSADSPILKPQNDQGYYSNHLVGGNKYDKFMRDPESVADWKHGAGCWFFNKAKYEGIST